MGEIHELFVLALSLVWFAGATPERNGCATKKRVFLESPFPLCPLKVCSLNTLKGPENLKGGREETDSPKTPFWTTVFPHDASSAPLARSDQRFLPFMGREVLLC